MEKIDTFLKNNTISRSRLDAVIYEILLFNIFQQVCNYLRDPQRRRVFKNKLRACSNKHDEEVVFNQLVEHVVKVVLTKTEKKMISTLISAHITKSEYRGGVSKREKASLLEKQSHKCKICGSEINEDNCHVDHIIPFKYVGDELKDNYQALCRDCNLSKGSNLHYLLKTFLYK